MCADGPQEPKGTDEIGKEWLASLAGKEAEALREALGMQAVPPTQVTDPTPSESVNMSGVGNENSRAERSRSPRKEPEGKPQGKGQGAKPSA